MFLMFFQTHMNVSDASCLYFEAGNRRSWQHIIPAKTGRTVGNYSIFTLANTRDIVKGKSNQTRKVILVMWKRGWQSGKWTRIESSHYWLVVFNTVCPVPSSFILMSLQLRAVDSTLDWRGLSCLLVTLATIAGHRRVCTLWLCRRTMVRNAILHF